MKERVIVKFKRKTIFLKIFSTFKSIESIWILIVRLKGFFLKINFCYIFIFTLYNIVKYNIVNIFKIE